MGFSEMKYLWSFQVRHLSAIALGGAGCDGGNGILPVITQAKPFAPLLDSHFEFVDVSRRLMDIDADNMLANQAIKPRTGEL